MIRPIVLAAVIGCALAGAAAAADAWTGPDRKRTPALMRVDVDFAMTELCFPWISGDSDPAKDRTGVIQRRMVNPAVGSRMYFVGGANLVVTLERSGSARSCTLLARAGDPAVLRAELDGAMARWPQAMTPGGYQYPANAYARRELFCAPPAGPHDGLLVSTGRPNDSGTPRMMVTLMRSAERSPRCDGVPPGEAARKLGL